MYVKQKLSCKMGSNKGFLNLNLNLNLNLKRWSIYWKGALFRSHLNEGLTAPIFLLLPFAIVLWFCHPTQCLNICWHLRWVLVISIEYGRLYKTWRRFCGIPWIVHIDRYIARVCVCVLFACFPLFLFVVNCRSFSHISQGKPYTWIPATETLSMPVNEWQRPSLTRTKQTTTIWFP